MIIEIFDRECLLSQILRPNRQANMKIFKSFILSVTLIVSFIGVNANDIQVSNATLVAQDVTAGANNIANFTFARLSYLIVAKGDTRSGF
jgi:hypothetical protein